MSTNPLRQPPFFPVANVNPDDPIRYGVSSFTQSLTVIALADEKLTLTSLPFTSIAFKSNKLSSSTRFSYKISTTTLPGFTMWSITRSCLR
jgi:hypothetical protein